MFLSCLISYGVHSCVCPLYINYSQVNLSLCIHSYVWHHVSFSLLYVLQMLLCLIYVPLISFILIYVPLMSFSLMYICSHHVIHSCAWSVLGMSRYTDTHYQYDDIVSVSVFSCNTNLFHMASSTILSNNLTNGVGIRCIRLYRTEIKLRLYISLLKFLDNPQ